MKSQGTICLSRLKVVASIKLVLATPAELKLAHGALHEWAAPVMLNEAFAARTNPTTNQLVHIRHKFPLCKLPPLLQLVPDALQEGLIFWRL